MCNVMVTTKKLLTIREAANILDVNPETLRRWDKSGKLKSRRHPINNYRLYAADEIVKLKSKISGDYGL